MGKTLLEISKEIGVSTATISRVLTGEDCVSPETRDKVLRAVKESGYEKRPRRRSAELRGSGTVLVIAGQLHNPITLGFIDGIRQRLAKEGMRTVISLSDYDTTRECDALKYASKNGFSGIFLLNAIESKKLVSLMPDIKTPMIFVNRFLHSVDTDVVTVDNYRCGYLATEYLIGRGHRRIAHIAGPATSVTCRDRMQGYLDAMREHGISIDKSFGERSEICVETILTRRGKSCYCSAVEAVFESYDCMTAFTFILQCPAARRFDCTFICLCTRV